MTYFLTSSVVLLLKLFPANYDHLEMRLNWLV